MSLEELVEDQKRKQERKNREKYLKQTEPEIVTVPIEYDLWIEVNEEKDSSWPDLIRKLWEASDQSGREG